VPGVPSGRLAHYRVQAVDYQPVGASLLWTLEQGLGANWTPQLADAWTEAYKTLADYMTAEAYATAPPNSAITGSPLACGTGEAVESRAPS
jgi:hypothetical protein